MQSTSSNAARQEFCVRWNSHLGSIGAAFPQLLAGQRFVDVTLACEGSQIHCHRLVLAACSSYFEAILAENPCKHPVIILPSEIKLWEIQALVDFMYKGEVNVTQAGLPQLLRCAEQLRIRGLYGSDAALNLNQLKALTGKSNAASTNRIDSGGGGGGGVNVGPAGNCIIQDNTLDTDENTNNSTTTTNTTATTATSMLQQQTIAAAAAAVAAQQHQQQQQAAVRMPRIKKERVRLPLQQTNGGTTAVAASVSAAQQQQILLQQQLLQQQMQQEAHLAAAIMTSMQQGNISNTNSNAVTEDDESGEDSTSNQYDEYADAKIKQQLQRQRKQQLFQQQQQQLSQQPPLQQQQQQQLQQHDTTIEDDHNYVAMHDEDDSYTTAMDTEHDSSANASLMAAGVDASSASYKRVRRSEASLAQAAKCVSKGQTFQTVSNMFNIPVSTIRFYMARKGILPKRKRGRGASTVNLSGTNAGASIMGDPGAANDINLAQAYPQIKRSDSPETAAAYHLLGYKQLNEQGTLI